MVVHRELLRWIVKKEYAYTLIEICFFQQVQTIFKKTAQYTLKYLASDNQVYYAFKVDNR